MEHLKREWTEIRETVHEKTIEQENKMKCPPKTIFLHIQEKYNVQFTSVRAHVNMYSKC